MADDEDEIEAEQRGRRPYPFAFASPPAGIGIDARGERVVDPTKNVEDLFRAGRDADELLREADMRYLDMRFDHGKQLWELADQKWGIARQDDAALRDAETRRIDQLA